MIELRKNNQYDRSIGGIKTKIIFDVELPWNLTVWRAKTSRHKKIFFFSRSAPIFAFPPVGMPAKRDGRVRLPHSFKTPQWFPTDEVKKASIPGVLAAERQKEDKFTYFHSASIMTPPSELPAIWTKINGALQTLMSPEVYSLWFPKFSLVEDSGKILTLICDDPMAALWVENSYTTELKQAAMLVLGEERQVKFLCTDDMPAVADDCAKPAKQPSRTKAAQEPESPARSGRKSRPAASRTNLNDVYTFDSFVSYEESQFAYKAGVALAKSEALFNPLFLYGRSGVGKTHLLQAIGHEVLKADSSVNVVYVTGEQFANEFIEASRTLNGQNFAKLRRKYRKADVLLVDDVQFISGKEKTVEEFLHTFDELFHAHKPIVLCADAAACDIADMDSRLAARMESGLTVELSMPDEAARLEILHSKRERTGMHVSDEILAFLANRIQKSVRRLEGALLRVATFTSLSGDMPDMGRIEQLLRDILREEGGRTLTVENIQKRVADFYELKVSDLTGKRRPNSIAFPRQIAMYLSRHLTECSLKEIGRAFGGRDHGTVIHANKLVASRMETDSRVRDIVQRLEDTLKA